MLPKNKRLDQKSFEKVYEIGSSLQTDVGYVKFALINKTQVACVASKDELPDSVDRTRVRRRAYAVVEDYFEKIPDGVGLIWFLPKTAQTVDKKQLNKTFKDIIKQINQIVG